jgi:hypothetical protein
MQWSKLQSGYGIVHRSVLQMKDISRGAKLLYALLCSYANKEGHCFPSEETMASDLKTVDRSIRRWLGELTFKGMLLKKLSNTLPAHNIYQVLYPTDPISADKGVRSYRTQESDLGGHRCPSKNTKEKNNNGEGAPALGGHPQRTEEEEAKVKAMLDALPWRKGRGRAE